MSESGDARSTLLPRDPRPASGPWQARAADVAFPRELRERLEAWSRESYPLEACGLLFGRRGGDRVDVIAVRRYANAARERAHDRFEIAPHDLIAADREALALGLTPVGTWHSHPNGEPQPSARDRASAWPAGVHAIVSVTSPGAAELAVFLG